MKKQSNIIIQSSNNGISRVILNEPSTYNALSLNMLKSLIECFENFNNDEKTKVIIIEGSGKGFSAGHDLREINFLNGKTLLAGFNSYPRYQGKIRFRRRVRHIRQ